MSKFHILNTSNLLDNGLKRMEDVHTIHVKVISYMSTLTQFLITKQNSTHCSIDIFYSILKNLPDSIIINIYPIVPCASPGISNRQ